MEMTQLNKRRKQILEYISRNKGSSNKRILEYFDESVSRSTVARDLAFLCEKGLIEKKGKGRGIVYFENIPNELLFFISLS